MADFTYVSFALSESCLGVCVLEGRLNSSGAAQEAHRLGINPGGQLLTIPFSDGDSDISEGAREVMRANTNRLISPEEARTLFEAKILREHRNEAMN